MDQIKWASFIVLTTVLALITQLVVINPVVAQSPNTTSGQNLSNTKMVVNFKNNTISIVDTTTNETIRVMSFAEQAAANTTTNENLTTDAGNTTNEILSPENTTNNETLTTNTGNATTNVNLTAKFDSLQGK